MKSTEGGTMFQKTVAEGRTERSNIIAKSKFMLESVFI
jgi:hypothetical protein